MRKILFLLLTAAAAALAQPAQVGGGTPVLPQCTATRLTNCTPRVDRDGILAAPSVLLRSYKIAELPATAPMNQVTVVVDAADCADPLTPGGTKACLVRWNGVAWVIFGGGGGGVSGTFTPRGLWASGTSYAALDLVSYDGIAYASVADDNVGHQPDTSPTWWATTGPPGPTGDAGADGEEVELQVTATHIQWRVGEGAWQNLVALADLKGEAGEAGSPGVPGVDGADGREVELQTTTTHIQWRYIGEVTWTDLVALSDLKGDDGGPGADGREVEFQKTATHIQWRYVGDSTWNNLVPLSDLKGDPGPSGIPNASDLLASGTQLTVTHDGGLTDPYALTFSCVDEDDGRKVEPSGVIATADDVTFSFASTETNVRCTVSLAGASLPPQLWKRQGGVLSPRRAGDSVVAESIRTQELVIECPGGECRAGSLTHVSPPATPADAGTSWWGIDQRGLWTMDEHSAITRTTPVCVGAQGYFAPFGMPGANVAASVMLRFGSATMAYRFHLPCQATVGTIMFAVKAAATAGNCTDSTCGLTFALYDDAGVLVAQTNVLTTGGAQDIATTGNRVATFSPPVSLPPGRYLLAAATDSDTLRLESIAGGAWSGPWLNSGTAVNVGTFTGKSGTGASIALPASTGALTPENGGYGVIPAVVLLP